MIYRTIVGSLVIGGIVVASACGKDGTPPVQHGPASQLTIVSGTTQLVPANTVPSTPIIIAVKDAAGIGVPGETVTFSIIEGGGSLASNPTATSDGNGQVTVPTWKMGKSAVPQVVRATLGTFTLDLTISIATAFNITVRFFGPPMTDAQKALFTDAAARIMGVVTGDLPSIQMNNADLTDCADGEPPLNAQVDDIIVYASTQPIDSGGTPQNGNILGRAGPCYVRSQGQPTSIVGTMLFDSFDIDGYIASGQAKDVILHEMLHTLGVGYWDNPYALLTGFGGPDPRFTGAQGRQGCVAVGGTTSCATTVPVDNTNLAGTRDHHWRENTFGNELMTGYYNSGVPNPFSLVTVRSLTDLGYTVNAENYDTYSITAGSFVVGGTGGAPPLKNWERLKTDNIFSVDPQGNIKRVRKP